VVVALDRSESGIPGEVGQTGARFGSPAMRRRMRAEAADEGRIREAGPAHTGEQVPAVSQPAVPAAVEAEVGHTGARFGSPGMRRRMRAEAVRLGQLEVPDRPSSLDQSEALDRLGRGPAMPEPGPVPGPQPEELRADRVGGPAADPAPSETVSLVRPYMWTQGRTVCSWDLRVETLVSVQDFFAPPASPEHRSIVALCASPHSVAEVAAELSVPVGVARVLVGDLIGMGVVTVHDSGGANGVPDRALLERVLAGLHRL
jgi:Protein of unknown function (DUF742)